jgi:hypothetical protein
MSRLLAVWLFAALLAVACQDRYRYECQDPKNWGKRSCNPPECKANETCTKYLIEVPNES